MAIRVSARREGEGLQLHLTGDIARRIDHELFASCVSEALACAERNACLDDGLKFTAACIETLSKHQTSDQCIERGFGLTAKGRR